MGSNYVFWVTVSLFENVAPPILPHALRAWREETGRGEFFLKFQILIFDTKRRFLKKVF